MANYQIGVSEVKPHGFVVRVGLEEYGYHNRPMHYAQTIDDVTDIIAQQILDIRENGIRNDRQAEVNRPRAVPAGEPFEF